MRYFAFAHGFKNNINMTQNVNWLQANWLTSKAVGLSIVNNEMLMSSSIQSVGPYLHYSFIYRRTYNPFSFLGHQKTHFYPIY